MELKTDRQFANVLVVDDDREMLLIIASLLERIGYHVHQASNLDLARELIHSKDLDLILCDAHLKGESGCDLLKALSEASHSVPLVMMTGSLEPGLKKEALLLGASGFLNKPFRIQELADTLRAVLDSRAK